MLTNVDKDTVVGIKFTTNMVGKGTFLWKGNNIWDCSFVN